jgi:hypothetical protein
MQQRPSGFLQVAGEMASIVVLALTSVAALIRIGIAYAN